MRVRIVLDGSAREVFVEGAPPDLLATVDGIRLPVAVRLDGDSARAEVAGRPVTLTFRNGVRIGEEVRSVQIEWVRDGSGGEEQSGTVDVRPPMPGRIVRVVAHAGERVVRGAPLLVLEAMKMQNEVVAPRDGTVTEVLVVAGDAVGAGQVLVRLEALARNG